MQPCTSNFSHEKCFTTKNHSAQEGREEKEIQSTSEEKVQSESDCPASLTKPTLPIEPTLSSEPNHTVVNTTVTTQMPVAKSAATAATSIPVTVYNLTQGKFEGIHYPTGKPQEEKGPSTPSCSNPQERQQPEAAFTATAPQHREDTR